MRYIKVENNIYEFVFRKLLRKWTTDDFIPNNYKYFLQSDEIEDWGSKGNSYFNRLNKLKSTIRATKEELFKLKSFDYYQGYVGERMNNLLRGTHSYLDNDSLHEYIEVISKTLQNHKLDDNIVVLRRINASFFKDCKINTEFTEQGFLSTSINLSHREDTEGNEKLLKNEALLVLKVPSDSNALYVEQVQEECRRRKEYELLIQKGSKIRLEKSYKIFSNRIILGTIFQN